MTRTERKRLAFLTSTHVVGPVIVTPVLLATRLHGTPLLALPAVVMAAVLAVRRPWRVAEAGRHGSGRRRPGRGPAGQGLTTALGAIAVFPAIACALTFLLRDPRRAVRPDHGDRANRASRADENPGHGPSTPMSA